MTQETGNKGWRVFSSFRIFAQIISLKAPHKLNIQVYGYLGVMKLERGGGRNLVLRIEDLIQNGK